jgi:hypothetical protein
MLEKEADAAAAGTADPGLIFLLRVLLVADTAAVAAATPAAAAAAAASLVLAAWLLVVDPLLVAIMACLILRAGSATAARLRTERRHSRHSVLQTGSSSMPVSNSNAAMSSASDNRAAGTGGVAFPSAPVLLSVALPVMRLGGAAAAGFFGRSGFATCGLPPVTVDAATAAETLVLLLPPPFLLPPLLLPLLLLGCCFTLLGACSFAGCGFNRMPPWCGILLPLLVEAELMLAASFCFALEPDPVLLLLPLRRTLGCRGAGSCFELGRNTCGCAKKPSLLASKMASCRCLVSVKICATSNALPGATPPCRRLN